MTARSTRTLEIDRTAQADGPAWKMNPDLELWVDGDGDLVQVTAEGTLDDRTAPCLVGTIEQLVRDGHAEILVDARKLQIRGTDGAMFRRVSQSLASLRVRVAWS